jgi:hypothetical protein
MSSVGTVSNGWKRCAKSLSWALPGAAALVALLVLLVPDTALAGDPPAAKPTATASPTTQRATDAPTPTSAPVKPAVEPKAAAKPAVKAAAKPAAKAPVESNKPIVAAAVKPAVKLNKTALKLWPGGKPWSLRFGEHVRLTPSLQYRPRLLANSGKDFAKGGTIDTVRHRARFSMLAELGRQVQIFVQLQDVRTWGEEINTLGDFSADGFDAHQAWAQLNIGWGLSLRVGRQELNLDGQRLVGAVGWTEQARSFDGALLNFAGGGLEAKLFWYKLRDKDAEGITDSTDFAGLWARYKAHPALSASVYLLYDRDTGADRNRITAGALLKGKPFGGLDYTLEGYLQAGQTNITQGANTVEADILAFMFAAELGYTLPVAWKPRLVFFFDYLSGDGDADDKVEVFDTLFATNHKFYGFMDFFLNLPVNTAGRGLIDVGGRLILEPWGPLMLRADVHAFMLAKSFEDPGGDERYLGLEVDGTIRYKLNRWVGFELVGGVFAPGRGMTCIRGGCRDDGDTELFGYLQFDAKI